MYHYIVKLYYLDRSNLTKIQIYNEENLSI